ncbi:hypothetical protein BDP27DRAFT_1374409 [Rhodocollybia butyracea]|uniref:SUN domain-containing protein n=1 Tax=Rhodocollybia butyracea TaxID=206335 RepID=A0A9P5TW10_9AGAR|nr:hypothetical protein BDP27DRAFT_1374409 [Rhodocollybia butyracea]
MKKLMRLLWDKVATNAHSLIIAAAVTSIAAVYSSQFQLRMPARVGFIICCVANLVLAFFIEEIPPNCDTYGVGRFCADCATVAPSHQNVSLPFVAPDYALSPDGAIVINLTSPTLMESDYSPEHYFIPTPPIAVIEEDIRVNRCWRFSGSQGHVAVKLARGVRLTNVTVYYPDYRELPSWRQAEAPKLLRIWALLPPGGYQSTVTLHTVSWEYFSIADQIPKPMALEDGSKFVQGGVISYDIAQPGTKQTFSVDLQFRTAVVIVEVLDNWGATTTCLHRLAVHGEEPPERTPSLDT